MGSQISLNGISANPLRTVLRQKIADAMGGHIASVGIDLLLATHLGDNNAASKDLRNLRLVSRTTWCYNEVHLQA